MGLGSALTTAVSSLRANQDALHITAQNIANANSQGYIRREIVQQNVVVNGIASGVEVTGVRRSIDNFLVVSSREQMSEVGRAQARAEFFERLDLYFGEPGASNSLNVYTDNFFSALTDLATSPEQASLRNNALQQGVILASEVQELAANLEDSRFLADQEISSTINTLNTKLDELFNINIAIKEAALTGADRTSLYDTRDTLLNDVAGILDVDITFDEAGAVSIGVPSGEILTPTARFHLTYNQLPSVQSLLDEDPVSAINITFLDVDGNETDQSLTLVSSSTATNQIDNISGGRLRGLIDMRDTDIPNMIAQLNEFAATLADSFNAIHNDGVGFPPATDLTGTTLLDSNDEYNFSGTFMLAALNADGSPMQDPYDSTQGLAPLLLDLNALNGGSGAGTARIQDLIEEINEYFGPPDPLKATVGALDHINLVSRSSTVSSTQASGSMVFSGQPGTASLSAGAFDFSGGALAAGDTMTIGGHTFIFKDDGQASSGLYIEIQSTNAATVAEIASHLNKSSVRAAYADVDKFLFSSSGQSLNLTSRTVGAANNGIALSAVVAADVANGSPTTPTAGGGVGTSDSITINGETYTFIPASANYTSFGNFIEIGANIGETVDNIASVLNASTDSNLNTATYISNGLGTLTVTHDQGTAGNSFSLDADFSLSGGVSTVDINGNGALLDPLSDNLSGGGLATGTFEFDLEFMNVSGSDVTFDVTSVAIDGGADGYTGAALPGAFTDYTAVAGQRARTTDSIAIDLTNSTVLIGGTHTISVGVQVTDADGNISTETIDFTFTVPETNDDIINDRFDVSGISGAGDGVLTAPSDNSSFLTAQLVDANGVPVAEGEDGYLRIFSNQTDMGFAIDEMTSSEGGLVTDATTATNRGLSHFFGLNDFFTSTDSDNFAYNFQVRDEYIADSGLLSLGSLALSTQPSDPDADPVYTYEVGAGSNQVVSRLSDLKFTRNSFDSAGGLPNITTSFSGYAAEIINFSALSSNTASQDLQQNQILLSAFTDRIEATGGVNLDEELANTIIFQNNYSASARIVNVVSSLLEKLTEAF